MARNLTLQILRGSKANLQAALPLALGEMYFATDTNEMFVGTISSVPLKLGPPDAVQASLAEPTLPIYDLTLPTL